MGMTLRSTNSGECSIFFSDATSGAGEYAGWVQYLHSADSMDFGTAGVEKMSISSTGAVTQPLQPAFMVQPASNQDNIPINANTTVVLGSEVYDIGGNFASNTFTAPVTGKYQLNVKLNFASVDVSSEYVNVYLAASNRSIVFTYGSSAGDVDTYQTVAFSILMDMDASDTAYIYINLPNQGQAIMDVTTDSKFSGYLVA